MRDAAPDRRWLGARELDAVPAAAGSTHCALGMVSILVEFRFGRRHFENAENARHHSPAHRLREWIHR
ncbi:hypothetical protein [Jiangella sp. DSM 45060]|uniref:hypothetical protein n=1 Tax=Jiangella sp. DSM 45060 TaxID=1798224 RepID=UPI0012FE348D|nr:hypothetical protein [Jiangella sp. DSM 45060]